MLAPTPVRVEGGALLLVYRLGVASSALIVLHLSLFSLFIDFLGEQDVKLVCLVHEQHGVVGGLLAVLVGKDVLVELGEDGADLQVELALVAVLVQQVPYQLL